MKLYTIEYYDTETDTTDYTTVCADNQIKAMKDFIRRTHGTKIITEIDKVNIQPDPYESRWHV